MISLDQTLDKLRSLLSAEHELVRINGLTAITTSKNRRATIQEYLKAIDAELAPVRQAVKDLADLPPDEPIQWAQSLLKMPGCFILEVDTTGLEEHAEICRITLANVDGSLFDDILIKPSAPIPASASTINGITAEQLADAPSLPDAWERIREGFQGRYVVSFAQEWDREQLVKAAQHHDLPTIYFLGEDLQRRLTQYYHKEYYLKLTDITERITGQPLPEPATAIDRVRAQCAIIAGMAAAVSDVRPPRPRRQREPEPTSNDDDGLDGLDDHPF